MIQHGNTATSNLRPHIIEPPENQLKHKDREIETLFTTLQNTIEIRDTGLPRCEQLARAHIDTLGAQVAETQELCRRTLAVANTTPVANESPATIAAAEHVSNQTELLVS